MNARVLVVEGDRSFDTPVGDGLRAQGHRVVAVGSREEAREELAQSDFDVVIADGGPPLDPNVESLALAEALGPGQVARAAELTRLRRENALLRARLERQGPPQVVTEDRAMADVVAAALRLAGSDVPVLLEGETGAGKRLLGRLMHSAGPRAPFPLLIADGAASPAALFGESGRPGALEIARRGDVLLTEVSAATPAVQAALVRALGEREFVPGGASRSVPLEARLLAATRQDLRAEVRAGRFREDLFYRLSGARLRVPPLRERKGDIPRLAAHVLGQLGWAKTVSPSALGALVAYAWPGNVRELEIVVERAALLTPGDVILAEQVALGPPLPRLRTDLSLDEMEREYIRAVLRENRGHRGRTARVLGIDPKTLYNKLGPGRPRKR